MNDKSLLLKQIDKLNKLYSDPKNPEIGSESILEKIDFLLESYLEDHPQDTEIWVKRIRVEFNSPWEDYDRIEKYVNSVLKYDKNNIQSLLLLAYAQSVYRGKVKDDLFIQLLSCCPITADKEVLSMIHLALSWYYSWKDIKKYEEQLLASIFHYNKHVNNYRYLAKLYYTTGRFSEAKEMMLHALANIRKVYENDYDYSLRDIASITSFFDEYYKGTHVSQPNLESMREVLD
jgi:hypothetical protein